MHLKFPELQPDRMPCVEAVRWAVSRVPTGRPFAGVTIERRRIESQPGNDCECVSLARVDGDPSARTTLAVTAKLR